MNEQYKTTEEVAVALGFTDERPEVMENKTIFSGSAREVSEFSEVTKELLTDHDLFKRIFDSFADVLAPVAVFNILGNPRDYNYTRGAQKTPEEVAKTLNILTEEVGELKEALETNNTAEIVDAICDIIYVALGIAVKTGTAYETCAAFPLVCHNNLLKLKEDAEGNLYADIINGKIQKPEGFIGLDLSKIIPTLKGGDNA